MKAKRLISLMLALMLVVSALSGLAVTASAEEDDVYVLNYDTSGTYGVNEYEWQYFSTYVPAWKYDGTADYNNTIAFTLTDTKNKDSFAVYCTDLAVGLDKGASYRRINLEDSAYAGASAGVLRSVMRKGFPNTPVADLAAAAGVEGLTVSEAVAATQLAIWKTAHGDLVEITDFCRFYDTDWTETGVTQYYEKCIADVETYGLRPEDWYSATGTENEATIEAHIEAAYNYLINLEPTAPTGVVASKASFVVWDTEVSAADESGNCTITATATVDVTVGAADSLTLTASAGEYSAVTALRSGKHEYTLTIPNVPADVAAGNITLAIDGTQALEDVYLFDAIGERGASQSLIGVTGNALPVHAEVSANDRILNIWKTDGKNNGLQNIAFDIYYVCSVEEYLNHDVPIGTVTLDGAAYFAAPSDADIANYVTGKIPVASIITNANGTASYNFGTDSDGIYIVVERRNAATTGVVDPFFVSIPGGEMADDNDKYVINIQPKNTIIDEDLEIEKDVTDINNEHDTYDVGEHHTWIIQSSIPKGLAAGLKYEITDTLDSRLTLVGVDRVAIAKDNGTFGDSEADGYVRDENETPAFGEDEIVLNKDTDYTVTIGADGNSFVVALTSAGMAKVAENVGDAYADYEIRVYFTAYINTSAGMNEEIPNQAHVDYTNNVGKDYEANSDEPDVITGAGQLLKVDASNSDIKLSGAAFQVYREAAEKEIADKNITTVKMKVPVTAEDGTTAMVEKELVLVSFYDNAAMIGDKVDKVVSDENGKGVIYGLAYGTYYLVETEAPAGYNLLPAPVEMVIDENSLTDEEVVTIYNAAGFQLPSAGGEGTAMFMVAGVVIIAAAMLLIFVPKKKNA